MKRKLALLLALVMVLSLVPMMSFAASGNTKTILTRTPALASDFKSGSGNTSDNSYKFDAPVVLVIEKDAFNVPSNTNFQLVLENAKWSKASTDAISNTGNKDHAYRTGHQGSVADVVYAYNDALTAHAVTGTPVNFEIVSRTDRVLDIKTLGVINTDKFILPLYFNIDGDGPVKLTIDPIDSGITGGTFTIANAAKGATVTTIEGVESFVDTVKIKTIRIEETSANSIKSGTGKNIRLRLPNNFEWTNATVTVKGIGGLSNWSATVTPDGRDIDIDLSAMGARNSNVRGSILIENAHIKASSNAREGDVVARVSGSDVTSADLVVAKYAEYSITVKADGQPRDLISGSFEAVDLKGEFKAADLPSLKDDAHKLQKLIITEDIAGSILPRRVRVEFPSWVKIVGVDVAKVENAYGDSAAALRADIGNFDAAGDTVIFKADSLGDNYIEFTPTRTTTEMGKKAKFELVFYVSVKPDMEGDIVATVSGRSGAEGEVVLGKARRPVEVSAEKAQNLVIGRKEQPIANITISEIEEEDIMAGNLVVKLPDDISWSGKPTIEVTEGDLKIDMNKVNTSGSFLTIEIAEKDRSTKPSTIVISNAKVDVNRTVAEGKVSAGVRGTAVRRNNIVNNELTLKNGGFDQNNVASVQVAEVVTPAPGEVNREPVSITIGQIPAGGDAAPYVKNNRTYAPVSAVAQSLGISKNNIIWNAENRTVTILGDKTVQMTIGSTTLLVNGTPVVMDVAPEITSGRTFLPIAWLAKALDVEYSWDAATQTVTFY